ncbi:MAG: FAD-binding oxidoreductase [Pseudomonadota bacterium]
MSALVTALVDALGSKHVITQADRMAAYMTEWRGRWQGQARCVVRPSSTADVAAVVRLCRDAKVAIVPQGGNTGLCGGAVSRSGDVLLALDRMHAIRSINAIDYSMTLEAGCTLANAQDAAAEAGRLLALDLSSSGSCQIGGNLSTNAGGVNVLRYGCAREQVLGLEVVLPSGEIIDGLKTVRKNTAGYDLKQLFIGAEGTLGVITAASLRLYAQPTSRQVFWLALDQLEHVLDLYAEARAHFDNTLAAFEVVSGRALSFVLRHIEDSQAPGASDSAWHVLLEVNGSDGEVSEPAVQAFVAGQMAAGRVRDARVAQGAAQASALWALRHNLSEAQRYEGASIKHDVSIPLDAMVMFYASAEAQLLAIHADLRLVCFGHIGDGNLHFNVSQPASIDASVFEGLRPAINETVHRLVIAHDGSISAEHGIGMLKRDILGDQVGETALTLMRTIKAAIDPLNLMNPGKVL